MQTVPARMMHITLICMATSLTLTPHAFAAEPETSNSLTIYSTAQPGAIPPVLYRPNQGEKFDYPNVPGYALIRHERTVNLTDRRSIIRFTDVASQIDPTTVAVSSLTDSEDTHVIEQSYEFDLVSTQKLMQRYIDKMITIEQVQGDHVTTFKGKLLSAGDEYGDGIVLSNSDGTVQTVKHVSNVLFPELPGGLITKPTLVWDIATAKPGDHKMRVSYESIGITWWADYNVVYTEGKDANSGVLDLGAWVSIINQTGASYPEAKLKLIAGDVNRAPKPQVARAMQMRRKEALSTFGAEEDLGFEEKSFFEYHLYTLGRPTSIPDNSTKQIELFPTARGVPCDKVLVYYGLANSNWFFSDPMTDRNYGIESNKKVDVYLQLKNSKESGMGMPLPSGRIRVSKLDSADGSLEFIGEDKIDHTPKDEKVLIKMGSAFDVVGERRQVDFKFDSTRKWMEEDIELKVRNHKAEPVKVIIKENLYRWTNWEIKQKSHEFEKVDARTIHFPVEVGKDGEVVVTYKVRYSW